MSEASKFDDDHLDLQEFYHGLSFGNSVSAVTSSHPTDTRSSAISAAELTSRLEQHRGP